MRLQDSLIKLTAVAYFALIVLGDGEIVVIIANLQKAKHYR